MHPNNLYWLYKVTEEKSTWFLPIVCVFFLLFYIILFCGICASKGRDYKKIRDEEKNLFKSPCIPKQIQNAAFLLSEKKYGYIKNYHTFQALNKACGLISITFSVIGIVSMAIKTPGEYGMDKWLGYVICLVSLISVFLVLYLAPVNRVYQYNAAWKICERKMNCAKASTCYYGALYKSYNEAVQSNKAKEIEIATKNIMRAALILSDAANEAEDLLSTDGD